jgi:hypothetical protein
MKKYINWKLFFSLLGLSLIGIVSIFPYLLSIQGEILNKIGQPIEFIFLAQFIQSLILFSVIIFFGLLFTQKINFQLPLLEAILEKKKYRKKLKNILGISILVGIVTAAMIFALDAVFAVKGATISTNYAPVWQKILASFYGGIVEEVLMRLFLMTFFIWVGMKLLKQNQPSKTVILTSIFLAAIIFGLGHLPVTASLTEINSLIFSRAILLNGIGGVVFGWLFWKKGLESAIIAHFTADIFLLTILPAIF